MFETEIFNSLIAGWLCLVVFQSFYYLFGFMNSFGAAKNPVVEGIKIDFSSDE